MDLRDFFQNLVSATVSTKSIALILANVAEKLQFVPREEPKANSVA